VAGETRRPIWINRDYSLLWSGEVVSTLGSQMSLLAYPLLALDLTGSPAKAGLIGTVATATRLVFRLPSGALVDRWDRRRTMLGCDLVRAVTIGTVALAVALGQVSYTYLLLAAFLEAAATVFFLPAETAALRRIVPKDRLPLAFSQNEARDYGATLAGPPLGGLLYGLSRALPFLGDFLSYVLSFAAISLIRTPLAVDRDSTGNASLLADIKEGLVWTWRQKLLRTLLIAAAGINLVFAGLTLAVVLAARESGAEASTIGLMLGAASIGGILGALAAPLIQQRGRPPVIILTIFWISAALVPVMAIHPTVWIMAAALATMIFLSPAANTILLAYQAAVTPDRLQGRVVSALLLIGTIFSPAAPIAVGVIAQHAGSRASLAGLAAVMAIVAIGTTLSSSVRHMPELSKVDALHEAPA
jgi:MFS family permease